MARPFAKKFYNSKEWRRLSKLYRESHFYICERCGAVGATQVHHKVHLNPVNINDPSVSLNPDNLELLCDDCHNKVHNRFQSKDQIKNHYIYDNEGHVVAVVNDKDKEDNNE